MAGAEVVMALLTAGSAGVSVWAVVVARGTRSIADDALWSSKDANEIANGSNQIAERSNQIATGANEIAEEAHKAANQANQIAEASNRLADESNSIAREAAQDARDAPISAAWDELLAAVAAIQTFDPASNEDVGSLLTAIRTRATLLIDKIEWPGFDVWVAREMRHGLLLLREADEEGRRTRAAQDGRRLTPDQALAIDEPFNTWVAAFTMNLRRFRRVGSQPWAFTQLTQVATQHATDIASRNGWPEPLDTIPGISPLDEDPQA